MIKTTLSPTRDAEAPRKGVRAENKARSRQRLLDSAKRLFMERGYDGATVRDIAAAADLSTGAVFASFADKSELFSEVLLADRPAQLERMQQAMEAGTGGVANRLVQVLSVGYHFQTAQLELMRAALGVSWSQGLNGDLGDRPIRQAAMGMIRQVLEQGVERGELGRDADLGLIVEMVWDVYVANYRQAIFAGWDAERLTDRFARQLDVLFAGQQRA